MNKKFLIILISIFLIPISFSCYNNSFQIHSSNDLFKAYEMLVLESRYNYFENDFISYYSENFDAKIKIYSDFIIIQSNSDNIDWENTLKTELYSLWTYNVFNLSEEDIIFISLNDCCGEYENGVFNSYNQVCENNIIIPQKDLSGILGILFIIIPSLLILIFIAKTDLKKYLAFIIGCAGWIIALILRVPLLSLNILNENLLAAILIPSLISGLFEEPVRFFLLKSKKFIKDNFFLFGLGWGFFEALNLYVLIIIHLISLNQSMTFLNVLPGFFERISAIIFHLALTIIVLKSLKNKKLLILAILTHSLFNLFIISLAVLNINLIIVQIIIFIISVIIFIFSNKLGDKNKSRKRVRKIKKKK